MESIRGPFSFLIAWSAVRMIAALAGLVLLLASASMPLMAQQSNTYGRRFLIPFPDTSHVRTKIVNPMMAEARLVLFSRVRANVTIRGEGFERALTLTGDSSRTMSLYDPLFKPAGRIFTDTAFLPVRSAIEVVSSEPIAVVAYFVTIDGAEAFTPLPVESWGREYRAMSGRNRLFAHIEGRRNEEDPDFEDAPSQVLVVASEDATVVTVTPVAGSKGYSRGSYTLDAGEVLLVQTAAPPGLLDTATRDLTGAHISSNRPVGVLSGNTRFDGALFGLPGTLTGNTILNATTEWLSPIESHGTTFVYTPIARDGMTETPEFIRVVATSPGITTVVNSNGSYLRSIAEGGYTDFNSLALASSGVRGPFALSTDRPAQAMVVGGGYLKTVLDSLPTSYTAIHTWGPAMSELVPRERWIGSARFHSPGYPDNLRHWVSIAADNGAVVLLDGRVVTFDAAPVIGTPFRFARIELTKGDHTLHAVSGRFTAIASGQARGYEAFEPLGTREDDEDPVEGVAHISKYLEALAVSYAYPVPGVEGGTTTPDSLRLTRVERCREATVTAERTGQVWMAGPLTITIDPASRNLAVVIDTFKTSFIPSGYRIRFAPVDPALDATGGVLLRNMLDSSWYVPYIYRAESVSIDPDPIEILGATPGVARTTSLTLTNIRPFIVTVLRVALKDGSRGFTLTGGTTPRSLAAGGGYALSLSFTGTAFSQRYVDSLIVETDCRTFTVPVTAQTAPPDPAPVPLITGYDWLRRRVGTAHDTLSFLSNAGDLDYTIANVEIISDPAGAFALVDPDWRTIGTLASGARSATGIRFTPPSAGDFSAEIVLTTTGGLRASAMLKGSGADPGVVASDVDLGSLCRTERTSGTFTVTNSGTVPLVLRGVSTSAGSMLGLRFDTASLGLPRTLAIGERLAIGFTATPRRVGIWKESVIVHTDADVGDSIAVIEASVRSCSERGIEVDDHDFGVVYITLSKDGFVTLRNSGAEDVEIQSMKIIDDDEGSFALLSSGAPFTLPAGDTTRIDARFSPATTGAKQARIEFLTDAGIVHAQLIGVGSRLLLPAYIRRDYHAKYGDTLSISVELEGASDVDLDSLEVTIGYSSKLLVYLGLRGESRSAGWTDHERRAPDSARLYLERPTRPGAGVLVTARFLALFSPEDSTELPLRIESNVPYVEFVERPGLFIADPICGLDQRLYELSRYRFLLDQNVPNPAVGATSIYIEIPFDNPTRLGIYDNIGREIHVVFDRELAAGAYTFTIADGTLPGGAYWYRLQSGALTATRRMIVQ